MTDGIAVIGLGCRFPDADHPAALWSNMLDKKTSFRELTTQRWVHRRFLSHSRREPNRTCAECAAHIEDVDLFAGPHFDIAARRAQVMDPQQRIILEVADQALEDAGLENQPWDRTRTATFVGASVSEYKELGLIAMREEMLNSGDFGQGQTLAGGSPRTNRVGPIRPFTFPGSLVNMTASVIAQNFNLGGPAYTIDAACASSLAAIVQAVEYLRRLPDCPEEASPIALAGGVYLNFLPDNLVGFARLGVLARRQCRPFDADAEGFVLGEGAGLVVLKRLSAALRDGDRIYSVIRGVACNSDGRTESSTTPSSQGQVALLRQGLADARVEASSIGYAECHGTATAAGDEVELRSLTEALQLSPTAPLAIGSIKANIGHCMSASGIAGFLRATLAVYHATLPPQAGWDRWHPSLLGRSENFSIHNSRIDWVPGLRRALVNSFGFGGTNAMAVLESAPTSKPAPTSRGPQVFCISADSEASLNEYRQSIVASAGSQSLAALAQTLSRRRRQEKVACVIVAESLDDLLAPVPLLDLSGSPTLVLSPLSPNQAAWLKERGVIWQDDSEGHSLVMAVTAPGQALVALGAAYLLGQTVDWKALWAPGPPADLPPSPWLRHSYWVVAPYQARDAMLVLFELVEAVAHIPLARLRPELRLVSDLGLDGQTQEDFLVALKENFAEALPNCLAGDPTLEQLLTLVS